MGIPKRFPGQPVVWELQTSVITPAVGGSVNDDRPATRRRTLHPVNRSRTFGWANDFSLPAMSSPAVFGGRVK